MKKDKYIRKGNDFYGIELSTNKYNISTFNIKYRPHSPRNWSISIGIPYLFYFYVKFKGLKIKASDEKEIIDLSFHNSAFWWKFGTTYGEWKSSTPKWRQGSFHFDDFFLGKSKHREEDIEYADNIGIHFPEGAYLLNVKVWTSVWSRPRWISRRLKRIEFTIPGGIPVEGKGENSWDCGMDAIFSSCMPYEKSAQETAQKFVDGVNQTRMRRGGDYSMEALSKDGYYVNNDGFITRDIQKSTENGNKVSDSLLAK